MAAVKTRSSKEIPAQSNIDSAESDMVVVSTKYLELMINKAIRKQFDDFKSEMQSLFVSQIANLEARIKDIETHLNIKSERLMQLESTIDKITSGPSNENTVSLYRNSKQ